MPVPEGETELCEENNCLPATKKLSENEIGADIF